MFDCVDNPEMKAERDNILKMKRDCEHQGASRPGDGKCDILAIVKYARDRKEGQDVNCGSNEVKEEIDCIDHPLLKDKRNDILVLKELCKSGCPTCKRRDCLSQINSLDMIFSKGGVCCPAGGQCNTNKNAPPPKSCNVKCAKVWNPFMAQCGKAFEDMMAQVDSRGSRQTKRQLHAFTAECHGHIGFY